MNQNVKDSLKFYGFVALVGIVILLSVTIVYPYVYRYEGYRTQTVTATTDYFSLSCSHLKDNVNWLMNQHMFGIASGQLAQMELQIMQLKHCAISSEQPCQQAIIGSVNATDTIRATWGNCSVSSP